MKFSSARAIRKTALRAYCGCRHRFTHELALGRTRLPGAGLLCKHNPGSWHQMAKLLLHDHMI